jgi:uncharacterized protein with GYD domain
MPKYLLEGNYVGDGVKGLLKEGGSSRRTAVEKLAKSVGGSVESIYYAFGDTDVYVIVDMPDHASMTAASLVANASGAVKVKTPVLMTPEEIDKAAKKAPAYTPPGR